MRGIRTLASPFAGLLLLACVSLPAAAYGPGATGADWGGDYYGHPSHLEWLSQYLTQHTEEFRMVDTCLDHITTDEDEKVPENVAKVGLDELTWWCIREATPYATKSFENLYFRYPDGVVPMETD